MTDDSTKREREALIAGDRAGALDAEAAADLSLFADLLADPSTWAEPEAALEDSVVDAVMRAGAAEPEPAVDDLAARRRRRRTWSAVLAAAAAIVIALGAFAVLRERSSSDFTAQLRATALAPGAGASAAVTRNAAGFRVSLDAHGLPALAAGEFYQAWLKNAAGTLVPIGSFSSGDGRVTLWSGVSPKDFPTLTVTIESTDNVQAPSGRRVLVGTVEAT